MFRPWSSWLKYQVSRELGELSHEDPPSGSPRTTWTSWSSQDLVFVLGWPDTAFEWSRQHWRTTGRERRISGIQRLSERIRLSGCLRWRVESQWGSRRGTRRDSRVWPGDRTRPCWSPSRAPGTRPSPPRCWSSLHQSDTWTGRNLRSWHNQNNRGAHSRAWGLWIVSQFSGDDPVPQSHIWMRDQRSPERQGSRNKRAKLLVTLYEKSWIMNLLSLTFSSRAASSINCFVVSRSRSERSTFFIAYSLFVSWQWTRSTWENPPFPSLLIIEIFATMARWRVKPSNVDEILISNYSY